MRNLKRIFGNEIEIDLNTIVTDFVIEKVTNNKLKIELTSLLFRIKPIWRPPIGASIRNY